MFPDFPEIQVFFDGNFFIILDSSEYSWNWKIYFSLPFWKAKDHFLNKIIFISGAAQLKEVCETEFQFSRWIDDKCYFFYDKEVGSSEDVQKICSDTFRQHGFENGRLYEPRDSENFVKIYKLAEEFSKRPTLQLWLGLNDKEKENEFVYNSNGEFPKINALWAGNLSN